MSSETLDFAVACRICQGLIPLADKICAIARRLEERGFGAFSPLEDFNKSFGTPEDIEVHRQYCKEVVKLWLSKPFPFRALTAQESAQIYSSTLIASLRSELFREYEVTSFEELHARYPNESWRYMVDPCLVKQRLAWLREGMAFERRQEAVRDEINARIAVEAEREAKHRPNRPNRPNFDPKGRLAFYKELMSEYAGAMGFRFDSRQTRGRYLVFSKPIFRDWSLCLVLENATDLSIGPFKGLCEPKLRLRHNSTKGEPDTLGKCIHIDYQIVILGFALSYWEFHDLDELALHVAAHVFLYGLCSETIEAAVRTALESWIP